MTAMSRWLLLVMLPIVAVPKAAVAHISARQADPVASQNEVGWGVMGAWATYWHRTKITADGSVTISFPMDLPPDPPCTPSPPDIEAPSCPEPKGARRLVRTIHYSIGAEGYQQIRAVLARLERQAGKRQRCTNRFTDVGSAWVYWASPAGTRNYALGEACSATENLWADKLVKMAGARLSDLANIASDRSIEDSN